jgi:hypothetical protein
MKKMLKVFVLLAPFLLCHCGEGEFSTEEKVLDEKQLEELEGEWELGEGIANLVFKDGKIQFFLGGMLEEYPSGAIKIISENEGLLIDHDDEIFLFEEVSKNRMVFSFLGRGSGEFVKLKKQ